jgi:truncated hemoglobin YjbI
MNSHDIDQDQINELVAFFYDLIRDDPALLAKVDKAFRERYGYDSSN